MIKRRRRTKINNLKEATEASLNKTGLIKLFADSDFESKLKLMGTKKLSKDEIQLRYKVIKK